MAIKRREPGSASKKIGESLEVLGTFLSLAESIPSAGVVGKVSGGLLRAVGTYLKGENRSLEQIRSDLNKGLRELKLRIVIMIDDIDRLETDQLLAILRLVRLNADLPYVTYVMAFDQGVVEKALAREEHAITGKDYLDKIVQVGLGLPAIVPDQLYAMFFQELHTVIGPILAGCGRKGFVWESERGEGVGGGYLALRRGISGV